MGHIKKFDVEIDTFCKIVPLRRMFKDKQWHQY